MSYEIVNEDIVIKDDDENDNQLQQQQAILNGTMIVEPMSPDSNEQRSLLSSEKNNNIIINNNNNNHDYQSAETTQESTSPAILTDVHLEDHDNDDEDESQYLPLEVEKIVSYYMLISHLITRMGDKMWEFIVPLTLIVITPKSLVPSSLYGLAITLVSILLGPTVGRLIDIERKLKMIRIGVALQALSIGTSGTMLFFLMKQSTKYESVRLDIFGNVPSTLMFLTLLFSSSLHSIAAQIMNISVERKWVPAVIKRDSSLTRMNTRMRQIDLITEVSAPFIAGLLTVIPKVSALNAFVAIAAFNFASFFPQFYFLQVVHQLVPSLNNRNNAVAMDQLNQEQQDLEYSEVQLELPNGADQQPSTGRSCSWRTIILGEWNPITNIVKGWRLFIRQPVFLVIMAFVFLWFTILSPHDPLLTAYLSSAGYTNLQLGIFRGIGALFGLISTLLFEPLVRRFDMINTATIYIIEEGVTVLLAGLVFTLLPSTTVTKYIFLVLIVVSRVGLYGFEIGEIHFVQRGVKDEIRGNISGVESSLTSLAMLTVFAGGLIVNSTSNFWILVWVSIAFINLGGVTLLVWRFSGKSSESAKLLKNNK
ncbi:hypothetical protein SAMD00019534_010720 [Acytostelium subglobosum LB1]|uniref:hypothetical protein n=1 Tax=Acytostelium subglobosum LB1 TaxID=1410327 RepID=UPI000645143D|nr:hypothetical protein SAMD00019534_010720 [Acytostelium subglobosum LB1]GAM17897.1 hypothetical protein SAMD00019534_010720 [Acytostelium subglobosum LB1]|eukprot:XP_012758493.1 hypothetical protein SAMD00019534_010720 [Acytostelium subglobosum LB1]